MKRSTSVVVVRLLAVLVPVLTCLALFTAYRYGQPALLVPLVSRSMGPPTSEDYAAYSAFIDEFFSKIPPSSLQRLDSVVISSNTVSGFGVPSLEAAVLGAGAAERDFMLQNRHPWLLRADQLHTSQKVRFASIEDIRGMRSYLATTPRAILTFSRIGFDHQRKAALLYYSLYCGNMCGRAGLALMEKSQGRWHIKAFSPGGVS